MKRVSVIAILLCVLVPAVLVAADLGKRDVFKLGEAAWISESEVTVPISILHDEKLAAMDIPLEWSDGVTLTEVSFAETRVDYFDIKIANIDEANNRVLIGLISMVFGPKDELEAGDGDIAYLTFRVDDAEITEFEVTPFTTTNPGHNLSFVYNDWSNGKPRVAHLYPEVEGNPIALTGASKPGPNEEPNVPTHYSLDQNFPNPFNPSTTLPYSLKEGAHVTISIYNVLGQNVKTLVNEYQDAGHYTKVWDGHDDSGSEVASGIYFYRIKAGDFSDIKKMVLMK
jgi:hypothetical protein